MKNNFKFLFACLLLGSGVTYAQVGVGTTTPNASSILDLTSTDKGLLLPRVQLTSLTSPAPLAAFVPGMVVYCIGNAGTAPNNVSSGVYVCTGNEWVRQVPNIFGSKVDITIEGNSTNPTYTINNAVVTSPKLATSLKIGGGSPSTSSVALEIAGGTKGFVVSTTTSLASITNPVVGMMVYSTTENCLRIYTATGWSNCLLSATGDASSGGSSIVGAYTAGLNKSTTPVYGKRVSGLTTTSSATVSTAGNYNIIASSATLPGLIFTTTGTFAGTGAQTITLTAVGTIDTAYAGTTHTFISNTTPNFTFTLTVAAMTYVTGTGNAFNAFYNGHVDAIYSGTDTTISHTKGESFDANSICSAKTISQTSPSSCTGSVTGASGTSYPLIWINGQCWFAKNLNEVPSAFASVTPTTVYTPSVDGGNWGYINTTTPDGSAGWGTSEPTNPIGNVGLLYQWSAAMNNTTTERSKGACPNGFHIPSDCEFMFLEHGLGMNLSEQPILGVVRSNSSLLGAAGMKLRSEGTLANNTSNFSALLAGYRSGSNISFSSMGTTGFWVTSTIASSTTSYLRVLYSGARGVNRLAAGLAGSFSVRCLKD